MRAQHCDKGCGAARAQRHRACRDPRGVRLLPVQDRDCGVGEPCHGTELSRHPPSLSSSAEGTQAQPWAAGTILGRSKAPKASLEWLRTAEQGKAGTWGCNDTTQIGAEFLHSCCATAGEGSMQTPGTNAAPAPARNQWHRHTGKPFPAAVHLGCLLPPSKPRVV